MNQSWANLLNQHQGFFFFCVLFFLAFRLMKYLQEHIYFLSSTHISSLKNKNEVQSSRLLAGPQLWHDVSSQPQHHSVLKTIHCCQIALDNLPPCTARKDVASCQSLASRCISLCVCVLVIDHALVFTTWTDVNDVGAFSASFRCSAEFMAERWCCSSLLTETPTWTWDEGRVLAWKH